MKKAIEFAVASTETIKRVKQLNGQYSFNKIMDGVAIHNNKHGSSVIMVRKEWQILPFFVLVKVIFPIVYFFKK